MKQIYFLLFAVLAFAKAESQVFINELDADTPSTNDKQFVELKSDVPFYQLDGFVLVFFNGSGSSSTGMGRSYYTVDLDGLVTDDNGLVVLGSSLVSPVPDRYIAESNIQLGADAVAIYRGDDTDWPDRTFPSQVNLVDALIYDTDDPDNTALMTFLGIPVQYNENENGNKTTESVQRKTDGTYETKSPTPHSLNDSTTPTYNGVSFTTSKNELSEPDTFDITFTLTQAPTSDFTLGFTFNNRGFDANDYTGASSFTIIAGQTSTTLSFTIVDDAIDEGDEFLRINLDDNLPTGFKRLKDFEELVVIDNDFQVAAYGTPLAPTYGIVASTAPSDYYNSLNNLASPQLETAITALISEENVVRIHTYNDVTEILKKADASPLNSNNVWLMYTEQERRVIDFQTGSTNTGKWNREHIWSRSRGPFSSIEYDEIKDGMSVWTETNADSLRHGNSDAHHLRATDGPENSSRGNNDFPEYNGPIGSQGSWHGDVARALFYMDLRYNNLAIASGNPANSTRGLIGDLTTLIEWHRNDPPDDFEMNRNNVIFTWQNNRNPFIDNPELVELIYGTDIGQNFTLSEESDALSKIVITPNPSNKHFTISNVNEPIDIAIYDTFGRTIRTVSITNSSRINHNLTTGIYLVKLFKGRGSKVVKLVVR
ncbi:endonuclease [uncultured Nonlabens sp.]|uniref:endonuclease n=1 Tax=uncultured Nonlabens sp. TaxID=859306 RepID=UPI0026355C6A|nr:endonuclease [uncultured Nonlabens sp.]